MSGVTVPFKNLTCFLLCIAMFAVGCKKNTASNATAQPKVQIVASPMPTFDFMPPAPQKGTLYGVIELGASTFNSFVVRMDDKKNWQLVLPPEIGSSLISDHMASEEDIKNGLKNYIQKIANAGVSGKNTHFVISSSAKEEETVQKIMTSIRDMGFLVNTVTAEQEAKHAFRATVPKEYKEKAFVLDMGSANTNLAYLQADKLVTLSSYGSKYFQKAVPDTAVYNTFRRLADSIPSNRTEYCFVIGAAPAELAMRTSKDQARYTVLQLPSNYQANGDTQKAGLNIYKAVADATGCKKFVFDSASNFTIGFVQGLKK
jgi:hypothetical protein